MLLRRLTDGLRALRLPLLAAVLVLSGCASTGPSSSGKSKARTTATGEVPAQALRLFELAAGVMARGDYEDAELRFKEFLRRYPDYPGGHVNLAIIHINNGDETAAQADIDAALALNPSHPAALNQQGMLFRRNGKFVEAEAAYLKAVTAAPDYALANYNLGVLNELYLQRLDYALQHFEQYQFLVGDDKQVEKWIVDLRRRVAANLRTANVAE